MPANLSGPSAAKGSTSSRQNRIGCGKLPALVRNCEILKSWCVISIADMLPAPRINDMLHRVPVAVVWESPQESGSQAAGIIQRKLVATDVRCWPHHFDLATLASFPARDSDAI